MSNRSDLYVRICLWSTGIGLLVEGSAMLAVGAIPGDRLPPIFAELQPDPLHNIVHVVWGLVIVLLLVSGVNDFGAALLAVLFGVFYVAFGFLGLLVSHPMGLILGPGQNVFHFIVGPTALILGVWALVTHRSTLIRPSA